MDSELEPEAKLASLIYTSQVIVIRKDNLSSVLDFIPVITQTMSLVDSMDLDSQPKPESELISLVKRIIYLFNSMPVPGPDSELNRIVTPVIEIINSSDHSDLDLLQVNDLWVLIVNIFFHLPSFRLDSELQSCIRRLFSLATKDLDFELKLISLLSHLDLGCLELYRVHQVISFVVSIDLELQPKPETKLMSLVSQIVSHFKSMDLDSQPKPLASLISDISHKRNPFLNIYLEKTLGLKPEPELVSLFKQIFSLAISKDPKWQKLISLCPQVEVEESEKGKFYLIEKAEERDNEKSDCHPVLWKRYYLAGENATHFRCTGCNGENHGAYEKAPVEITHPLHPKHSLQLVLFREYFRSRRQCYCCGERLKEIFYCCLICNFFMNLSCAEKPSVLSIEHSKWHDHKLVHFRPRQASLTCDLCALSDSSCPFFICPPCDFVVHQSCTSLPHVIKISRHPHRISFTPSFGQGNWSCGVCRREIDNSYGGYSCIKAGCLYAAHSKCATQSNVWDGAELEGVPEETEEEEDEPFMRIRDGIIQHFSHQHHHMEIDENTGGDYDENKQCQGCITPIYFGKFYSCLQCEFILHEKCANLSRKMHHPLHPHLLTLVPGHDRVLKLSSHSLNYESSCSACQELCIAGFFYECSKEGCRFKVHVQCATISEPLDHVSHMHPLFLTSKQGEERVCGVCYRKPWHFLETFNCIECDYSLCFDCATIPQKVRYKHDKHAFTLSYAKETSTMKYWCELCEEEINTKEGFYICEKYCCVSLHIECLIGKDIYMKPGVSWLQNGRMLDVLPNNQHMSRPFCTYCEKRCLYRIVFQRSGFIFCSAVCMIRSIYEE